MNISKVDRVLHMGYAWERWEARATFGETRVTSGGDIGLLSEQRAGSARSLATQVQQVQFFIPCVSIRPKSKYNNGLIAKLMLMWRREEMREMKAWLSCKHQARHESIDISGPK
jgi:hypothetical protein